MTREQCSDTFRGLCFCCGGIGILILVALSAFNQLISILLGYFSLSIVVILLYRIAKADNAVESQ